MGISISFASVIGRAIFFTRIRNLFGFSVDLKYGRAFFPVLKIESIVIWPFHRKIAQVYEIEIFYLIFE